MVSEYLSFSVVIWEYTENTEDVNNTERAKEELPTNL